VYQGSEKVAEALSLHFVFESREWKQNFIAKIMVKE
jgi:hypothetical protein